MSSVDTVLQVTKNGGIASGFKIMNAVLHRSCQMFLTLSTKNEHNVWASRKPFVWGMSIVLGMSDVSLFASRKLIFNHCFWGFLILGIL
jgi:hypothetical protein